MVEFSVMGQPQGKARAKVTMVGGYARAYTPEKTAAYENLIKLACPKVEPLVGQVVVEIIAYYLIPKSYSKDKHIKALSGELRPTTKPDGDNISKVVCDALNGIAYKDDSQIVQLLVCKWYSEQPRIVVKIMEVK